MNYYNPYYMARPSLFSSIGRINFKGILSGTQKTLNFVNQAIPVVKQISPVVKNAKTMFRVMNEMGKVDNPKREKSETQETSQNNITEGPNFFI